MKAESTIRKEMSDMPKIYIPDVIWMSSKQGGNFLIVDISPDIFKKEPRVYGKPLPYLSLKAVEERVKTMQGDNQVYRWDVLELLREIAGEK